MGFGTGVAIGLWHRANHRTPPLSARFQRPVHKSAVTGQMAAIPRSSKTMAVSTGERTTQLSLERSCARAVRSLDSAIDGGACDPEQLGDFGCGVRALAVQVH